MKGYNGKILRVDLSSGGISEENLSESFCRTYLGGRGFISYFLLKEMKGGEDALGPKNKLIFAAGPINGAPIAGSGRNSVGAKSPLTNCYGDAEAGGYWGAELKHAGFDAIIIDGISKKPVYIWIQDGKAEIKDASHLWGKTTGECQRLIQEELGDKLIRVAQTGPAGENLVRYASIVNDLSHVAGRCGLGAVMGSKKLRAIAVRGRQKMELADTEAISTLAKWMRDNCKNIKFAVQLNEKGTAAVVAGLNTAGGLPTRNFNEGSFSGAAKISAEALNEIVVDRGGCYACPIHCKPVVSLNEPYKIDPAYGGPEYETIGSFGSNCCVDDIKAVAKAHELCNAYGLDSISTGDNIAFAMECFEAGIITEKDTGGLKLNFGNAQAMVQMVEMIAVRKGIGAVLAEGTARAAKAIGKGAENFAMHVKGQELPLHEPRYKPGMGVGYTISSTGADHSHNMHDAMFTTAPFLGRAAELDALGIFEPLPLQELSPAKMRILYYMSTYRHVHNSLVYCYFVQFTPSQVAEIVKGVTGWDATLWELMKAGERCNTMMRLFNIREGKGKSDDSLPERFFTPLIAGPLAGSKLSKSDFNNALEAYYAFVGWDKNGVPTEAKLQELGIIWAGVI